MKHFQHWSVFDSLLAAGAAGAAYAADSAETVSVTTSASPSAAAVLPSHTEKEKGQQSFLLLTDGFNPLLVEDAQVEGMYVCMYVCMYACMHVCIWHGITIPVVRY